MDLEKYIGVINNFPKKGISFKDISPLLKNPEAFRYCISEIKKKVEKYNPTIIVGPESRAFIFGIALAQEMNLGFVMARKPGKLPGNLISISYGLEYGEETLSIQEDALSQNDRVLLIDDLMATGGTLAALKELIIKVGATPVAAVTPITLKELNGDKKVGLPFETLLYLSDKVEE